MNSLSLQHGVPTWGNYIHIKLREFGKEFETQKNRVKHSFLVVPLFSHRICLLAVNRDMASSGSLAMEHLNRVCEYSGTSCLMAT